jgi:hypothetical protein
MKGVVLSNYRYSGLTVEIDKNQIDFKVIDIKYKLKQRNIDYSSYLAILKYIFVASTFLATFLYYRSVSTQCDYLYLNR